MVLKSEHIYLRPVEREDATRIMLWENNPKHWKVTGTEVPFSLAAIYDYIEQAQHIRTHGQLRLLICLLDSNEPIGTVDLYQADFKHMRAAVGILIAQEGNRNNGYALEAINLIEQYAGQLLAFHNLHCSIHADNLASIRLFEKAGYTKVGIRKDWFFENQHWIDELIFQKCLKKD
jgi:diamine N-acetyltransferase